MSNIIGSIQDNETGGEMNKGEALERFTEYVYSELLTNENLKNTKIYKNHKIVGRSGANHEYDVYYEIVVANICHKVAIECKDHERSVTKGMVQEFYGKLADCNNIIGIIVASGGYQSGARDFANHYGIKPLTSDDLPNMHKILASYISCLLPEKNTHGDPFWVIMEERNGKCTGSYASVCENTIVLFLSRKSAENVRIIQAQYDCHVYGVTLQHLKGICAMSKIMGIKIAICPLIAIKNVEKLVVFPCSHKDIEDEYLHEIIEKAYNVLETE